MHIHIHSCLHACFQATNLNFLTVGENLRTQDLMIMVEQIFFVSLKNPTFSSSSSSSFFFLPKQKKKKKQFGEYFGAFGVTLYSCLWKQTQSVARIL